MLGMVSGTGGLYPRELWGRMVLEELLKCRENLPMETDDEDPDGDIAGEESKDKYGPGGEGELHRRLKEFVGEHPDVLNLGPGKAMIEHRFTTGDRVDVAVDLDNGEHCVVEIEVEDRNSTLVGAHQALKYRALRAGQLNTRKQPHAFLIAYSIPKSIKKFCKRHGVTALEIQPGECGYSVGEGRDPARRPGLSDAYSTAYRSSRSLNRLGAGDASSGVERGHDGHAVDATETDAV